MLLLAKKKQGERVVLDLIDGLKGHNVTMDNFFLSYELALKLLEKVHHYGWHDAEK